MRQFVWILQSLIIIGSCMVFARELPLAHEMKSEAGMITTMAPPEGNSTFLGGTTWCVARPGAPQADLKDALDWACGLGRASCGPIQKGGACFEPDTMLSHASYAFNSYYQQNGNNDIACNFGGTAMVTKDNPSYDKCVYAASGDAKSSASPSTNNKLWCRRITILLLYFIRQIFI